MGPKWVEETKNPYHSILTRVQLHRTGRETQLDTPTHGGTDRGHRPVDADSQTQAETHS